MIWEDRGRDPSQHCHIRQEVHHRRVSNMEWDVNTQRKGLTQYNNLSLQNPTLICTWPCLGLCQSTQHQLSEVLLFWPTHHRHLQKKSLPRSLILRSCCPTDATAFLPNFICWKMCSSPRRSLASKKHTFQIYSIMKGSYYKNIEQMLLLLESTWKY